MPRYALFFATSYLILAKLPFSNAAVEHCHDWDKVAFCMAVNRWQNISASSTDLVVTLGYQKSSYLGWMALGLGSGMIGALIFVTYEFDGGEMPP